MDEPEQIVVDPKRTNVKAVLLDKFKFHAKPGECQWDAESSRLEFACPGCGQWGSISCGHPKPARSPSWDITAGSPEDPGSLTLSPSINCIGCCAWHGHLRNGLFVSC